MLNVSIEPIFCKVRREYLFNHEEGHGEYEPGAIFGAHSVAGEALGFHFMLENGAVFSRVPVSGFCWQDCAHEDFNVLQMWDCFGEEISNITYVFLKHLKCKVRLKTGDVWGKYITTFDWHGNGWSETPWQYKCAHMIALETGNYALQPNNKLLWLNPSFTSHDAIALTNQLPKYKSDARKYVCESTSVITDSNYFYNQKEGINLVDIS